MPSSTIRTTATVRTSISTTLRKLFAILVSIAIPPGIVLSTSAAEAAPAPKLALCGVRCRLLDVARTLIRQMHRRRLDQDAARVADVAPLIAAAASRQV